MNILLVLWRYHELTGSEMYTYELARGLKRLGHQVGIVSNLIGGEIAERSRAQGILLLGPTEPSPFVPDVVHTSQPNPTSYALYRYPDTPIVSTIHSRLDYEKPIVDPRIRTYICIRPEIKDVITERYDISRERCQVIYNGVDTTRFNTDYPPTPKRPVKRVLFVGTADQIREQVVTHLQQRQERGEIELQLVGQGFPHPPVWDIERAVKDCDETASVYMGRTTIEGWLCGKPGWIYDVDEQYNLIDIQLAQVPAEDVLNQFDIETMINKIYGVYRKAIDNVV